MTQPMPQENPASEPVEPKYINASIVALTGQLQKGIDKYGTALMTFNGRNAYRDAMAEWSDLGRYMTQIQMERECLEQLLVRALDCLDKSQYSVDLLRDIQALNLKETDKDRAEGRPGD